MAESSVQVNSGAGPKLHTWNRSITGPGSVEDEFMLPGEYPYPTFLAQANVSIATANDHALQVMAGASLSLKIRRIRMWQEANATAANVALITFVRLTSAGTGGTVLTVAKFDTGDTPGATAMSLPTVKGTEGATLWTARLGLRQAFATTGPIGGTDVWEWVQLPNEKPIIIPSGTANGIACKVGGNAAATASFSIEFVEQNF